MKAIEAIKAAWGAEIKMSAALVEALDPDGWWIEAFKSGKWTGARGGTRTYDDDDIDGFIEAFYSTFPDIEPVLRLGDHPGLEPGIKPAIGSVTALKRVGSTLMAYISDVPKIVRNAIEKKLYRKVSIGLLPNFETQDGKTFPFLLEHIAVLGAELPAVSGLADLSAYMSAGGISDDVLIYSMDENAQHKEGGMTVEELQRLLDQARGQVTTLTTERDTAIRERDDAVTERDKLVTSNQDLKGEVAEFRTKGIQSEVEAVVDDAVKAGTMLPKNRDDAVATGVALRSASVNLSKGDADPFDNWKNAIKNAGKVVEFSEKGKTGEPDDEPADKFQKEFDEGAKVAKAISLRRSGKTS